MSERAIHEEESEPEVRDDGSDSELGEDELREISERIIIRAFTDLLPRLNIRRIREVAQLMVPYLRPSERNIRGEIEVEE